MTAVDAQKVFLKQISAQWQEFTTKYAVQGTKCQGDFAESQKIASYALLWKGDYLVDFMLQSSVDQSWKSACGASQDEYSSDEIFVETYQSEDQGSLIGLSSIVKY